MHVLFVPVVIFYMEERPCACLFVVANSARVLYSVKAFLNLNAQPFIRFIVRYACAPRVSSVIPRYYRFRCEVACRPLSAAAGALAARRGGVRMSSVGTLTPK